MRLIGDRRLRPFVFLMLNALVGAAVYFIFIAPIVAYFRDADETIEDRKASLARMGVALAQAKSIMSAAKPAPNPEFYTGADGAANAALQSRLKSTAEASSVSFLSVRSLSPRKIDQIEFSGARIEVSGTLDNIRRMIYSLETAVPAHFVIAAIMHTPQQPARPDSAVEPTIDAQLDVYAPVANSRSAHE